MNHSASERARGPSNLLLGLWLIPLAVLFVPVLPADRCFALRDVAHYYPPLLQTVVAQWSSGMPLWNPLEERGRPLWADPTATVLYPGLCLFALPVTFATAFKLYIVVHVWLCGVNSWIAARRLGLSNHGAAITGVSYALGGSVLFQYCNPPYLAGAAWLPLGLSSVLAVVIGGSSWSGFELTFVLTLLVLAGDPQTAYLLGILGLASVILLVDRIQGPAWRTQWRLRGAAIRRLTGVGALAVGLSAAQWMPTLDWALRSERSSVTGVEAQLLTTADVPTATEHERHAEARYRFSIGPWRWLELVWPNFSGRMFPQNERWIQAIPAERETWAPSLYFGLVPLLLTVGRWRLVGGQPIDRWLSWLVLFGALGSLGRFGIGWMANEVAGASRIAIGGLPDPLGGLYWGLSQFLPGFFFFRYPAKLWIWTALALSLLAGRQLDALLDPTARTRLLRHASIYVLVTVSVLLLVAGFRTPIERWWLTAPVELPFGPLQVEAARQHLVTSLIHGAVLGGLVACLLQRVASPSWWLVLLTAGELTLASRWMIAIVTCGPVDEVAPWITARREQASTGPPILTYRLATSGWYPQAWQTTGSDQRLEECRSWDLWTARPKYPLSAGLAAFHSETSFSSREQRRLLALLDTLRRTAPDDFARRLAQLGVDYVCSPHSQQLPGLVPLEQLSARTSTPADDPGWRAEAQWWSVTERWPYAWITHDDRLLDARDSITAPRLSTSDSDDGTCRVQQVSGGRVVIDVQMPRDGWLVLNATFAPGWDAERQSEDGTVATTVVAADRYYCAVSLPAGYHRVTFVYRPRSVRWGLALSGLSAATMCLLAWRISRVDRRRLVSDAVV